MARCDENVKAVQEQAGEVPNKNWLNKRTMVKYSGHRWCKIGRRRLFRCRSDPICKESSRNVGNKAYITSANNERARIVALQNLSNPTSQRRPYTKTI
ncbi:hypothetical protein NPIL_181241 [Nephila pilipes]|uniref:Uncharacterized protein n=1 Tax=Nephila pilipes TaxID=299642 RepID=A0A8X6TFI2_NEPPI|nr:hypothetical protein NPIL_181241 [Nephila pilipes]